MKRCAVMAMICAAAFFFIVPVLVLAENQAGKTQPVGPKRLEGRWLRPDGGYILELSGIKKDGNLKAAYFNPRPINVARAGFKNLNGKLSVFVELRDVNYPGSLYELQYDPGTDRLKGTYFQAVEKKTFDIEFVRVNKP